MGPTGRAGLGFAGLKAEIVCTAFLSQAWRGLLEAPKNSGVWDALWAIQCGASYVEQTGRLISIQVTEHKCHVRSGQTEKSAIVQHCWVQGHQVQFAKMSVLFRSDSRQAQFTRESLEIAITRQALNQEEGWKWVQHGCHFMRGYCMWREWQCFSGASLRWN